MKSSLKTNLFTICCQYVLVSFVGALPTQAFVPEHLTEQYKLINEDAVNAPTFFGYAVALNEQFLVVGAPLEASADGLNTGGAVFIFDADTGEQLHKIVAPEPNEFTLFGWSVALSGDQVLVGAPSPNASTGSAYLFNASTGVEVGRLDGVGVSSRAGFGESVALTDQWAVVGAPQDRNPGNEAGAVYIFDLTNDSQYARLTHSPISYGAKFGKSVSINGDVVLVGAPLNSPLANQSGSAHIYNILSGDDGIQVTQTFGRSADRFGSAVSVFSDTALVGMSGSGSSIYGEAYLFDTQTGSLLSVVSPENGTGGMAFGSSAVSVTPDYLLISATNDNIGSERAGSVYVFDANTGLQYTKLLASDPDPNDRLGSSIAVYGHTVVVGCHRDNDGAGSVYVYRLPCSTDLTHDDNLNFFDVSAFLVAYLDSDPIADWNGDGAWNFFDVSEFLVDFKAGCP